MAECYLHNLPVFLALILVVVFSTVPVTQEASSVAQEFKSALENERYFVVLFTKPCCDCTECLNVEGVLKVISQEVGIKFAKITDEVELREMYGVEKLPTVLLIRNKKSILYTGKAEKDALTDWISDNTESFVKDLDDDSFEHLTQASSGATTGDWITFFCSSSNCRTIESTVEAVGARLRREMNVAVVDVAKSPKLASRFDLKITPEVLFFRHGKYYNYDLKSLKLKVDKLVNFCKGSFKNYKATPVPQPKSPFDEFTEDVAAKIKEFIAEEHSCACVCACCAGLIAIIIFISFMCCKTGAKKVKKID